MPQRASNDIRTLFKYVSPEPHQASPNSRSSDRLFYNRAEHRFLRRDSLRHRGLRVNPNCSRQIGVAENVQCGTRIGFLLSDQECAQRVPQVVKTKSLSWLQVYPPFRAAGRTWLATIMLPKREFDYEFLHL
jgi:hypothetical protein